MYRVYDTRNIVRNWIIDLVTMSNGFGAYRYDITVWHTDFSIVADFSRYDSDTAFTDYYKLIASLS